MATNITIDSEDVVEIAPELENADSALFDLALSFANQEISLASWGDLDRANRAARYLVAHLVTQLQPDEEGVTVMAANEREVQSETVGGVSRTYAKTATGGQVIDAMTGLEDTAYGREYIRLSKARAVAHRMQVL